MDTHFYVGRGSKGKYQAHEIPTYKVLYEHTHTPT